MQITPLPPPAPILLWERRLENKPCEKILQFDEKLRELYNKLKSTCYSHNAVGLAAPQIGEFVQVAIVHYPADIQPLLLVNPVIDEIRSRGEQTSMEGCLSIPQRASSGSLAPVSVRVRRCMELFYSYQNISGRRIEDKATGFLARAISHEVDHLSGIFFINRIGDTTRSLVMRNFQNFLRTQSKGMGSLPAVR